MSRKPADDLLAELDSLGIDEQSAAPSATQKPAPKSHSTQAQAQAGVDDEDVLADLQAQLAVKPAQPSRPSTPRISSSTTSGTNKSPKRAEHTPASSGPPSQRNSEDRLRNGPVSVSAPARTSGEGRSYHQSFTPSVEEQRPAEEQLTEPETKQEGGGGGWWGSMFSAASAAVKQAETIAREIRGNEEAQRWAEQVKGNISNLQNFGTDLRTRALPTFTTLLSHIAPPISAHERLQIHTTHPLQHYPSLDPLIYATFSRIMAQVEGGDLLVIQRGSENQSRSRATSEPQGYRGGVLGGAGNASWTDGPWWREDAAKRDIGAVAGLRDGSRLARASAEAYATEFFDTRGGVEAAAQQATETLSESNPVRSSDIFLAIQAIAYSADKELFASADARGAPDESSTTVVDPDEEAEELVCFAIYLHDPIHTLSFSGLSQPFPQKWAGWLDAANNGGGEDGLPESITEIIQAGGVDPREWVAEWMEEVLSLAVGVVAQRYVARRMGVGEGGLGRGKRRAEEEGLGGEAARAL
ncbi:hypothetical protein LTR36_005694 [Oleoguttula mirabilis]|uniref:Maintenance of telomere capping protein 1 n=1 Tax=Oleoguttula mirabilis TaxID=1507867 RepID=A0AAV9JDY9_9PEZI|nr:hypothetical protein LTR36_005694 [Oleoguttula mirabilis]